jgi:hypothetical protein
VTFLLLAELVMATGLHRLFRIDDFPKDSVPGRPHGLDTGDELEKLPALHGLFAGERGMVTSSTPPGTGADAVLAPGTAAKVRRWLTEEILT